MRISDYNEDISLKSSYVEISDDKTRSRYASYEGYAISKVEVLDQNKQAIFTFDLVTTRVASSNIELPKPHSKSSLKPLFEHMLNIDHEKSAIKSQNSNLEGEAIALLRESVGKKIALKITPTIETFRTKFLDDEDDMGPAKSFVIKQDYDSALAYLTRIQESSVRPDIFYNLGVVYEALRKYDHACDYYRKAYELEKDSDFLEQEIDCQKRAGFYHQIYKL